MIDCGSKAENCVSPTEYSAGAGSARGSGPDLSAQGEGKQQTPLAELDIGS
jgi:hypothetical protein